MNNYLNTSNNCANNIFTPVTGVFSPATGLLASSKSLKNPLLRLISSIVVRLVKNINLGVKEVYNNILHSSLEKDSLTLLGSDMVEPDSYSFSRRISISFYLLSSSLVFSIGCGCGLTVIKCHHIAKPNNFSLLILTAMPTINFLLGILSLAINCTSMDKTDRVYNTTHFKFFYTVLDDTNIKEIADSLETSYPKITSHLQSGDLPVINVHFYENIADLNKVFPDFPKWAVGQAISLSEIHMISPNDPKQDYQTMIRNTKHEFAHCVSMKINSTINNNPRWLWESVALYEANLPWDPHMLPYLVSQKPPSLKELNEFSNPSIYEVGYFIAQFIAETHGTNALKSLIQNNGNLKDTLNTDDEEFTKQWFAFMKKKYGI